MTSIQLTEDMLRDEAWTKGAPLERERGVDAPWSQRGRSLSAYIKCISSPVRKGLTAVLNSASSPPAPETPEATGHAEQESLDPITPLEFDRLFMVAQIRQRLKIKTRLGR